MKKLDIRLLRMVRQSKGQFISVSVIVAVALCIYIMFSMTSINISNAVDHYYDTTNISDLEVDLMRIPEGALKELKSIQGVRDVQGRISIDVPLQVPDKEVKANIRIISLPEGGGNINKLYFAKDSKFVLGDREVILLEQFAKARKIKPGDVITPNINGRSHNLEVTGTAASSEFVYLMENEQALLPAPEKFGVAYVTEAFARSVFGFRGSYNEVLLTVDENRNIDDIADDVEKLLDKYGVKRIIKLEDQLSNNVLNQKIDGIEKMSSALPVLFLIVAAIIISIMLSRIVNNDRIAIGVLKALGYGNLNIVSHYTKYALAIGLLGSITGITAGLMLSRPLSQVFVSFFNIPLSRMEIDYGFIINGILLTSIFCISSGLIGARGILKIMPADSMRPEAPKTGKRILLERVTIIWRHISFSWKMVLRNIMRNKRRFAFLVLGLALAYSINTVPLYMGDAMISMFEIQYGEYQKVDYTIGFSHPMNESAITDINHLITAKKIEPRLEYPFELVNGWRKKAFIIIGVPRQTTFYEFVDTDNNKVKLPENGIFITEAMAKSLKVKEGETIVIKNFLPGREDVSIQVKGIIKQYLGANAYMDIKEMEALLMDKQMITGLSVKSDDNLKEKLMNVKNVASVSSAADIKNSFEEYLDTIIVATKAYMLFGGILGFALIYNATIIGISERTMEFASLRIMGFDKKDIYGMVSKENFLMTGIAILIGIPMGAGMIRAMVDSFSSEMITLPVLLTPGIFIQAAVASVIFVIIAQLATLKKIYSLNFIDALKSRIS